MQWLLAQGLALATVNHKLSTVKVYDGLAAQAGVIDGGELALIKHVKGYAAKEFKKVDDKRQDVGRATRVGHKKPQGAVLRAEQARALKNGNPLGDESDPQGQRSFCRAPGWRVDKYRDETTIANAGIVDNSD